MEILFLGTAASAPSRDRATSCIAVRRERDVVLMDCGEGSQRQLMASPLSFMRIRAILITHLHGDHILGLPGLLQTMSLIGRKDPLEVYGPEGIVASLNAMMEATGGDTAYELAVREAVPGDRIRIGDLTADVFATDHGVPSLGYRVSEPDRPGKLDRDKAVSLGIRDGPDMARLKRGETVGGVTPDQVLGPTIKGTSVVYTGDTRPCPEVLEASMGADVLVHESTYMDADREMAREHFHSTAVQAAEAASRAGVRALILTHVSGRYDDLREDVLKEASEIFPESYLAEDFDMFSAGSGSVRKISEIR